MTDAGPFERFWQELRRLFAGNLAWEDLVDEASIEDGVLDVLCGWIGGTWERGDAGTATTTIDGLDIALVAAGFGRGRVVVRVLAPLAGLDSVTLDTDAASLAGEEWPAGGRIGEHLAVRGDPGLLASFLDAGTRQRLTSTLVTHGLRIKEGEVRFSAEVGDGTLLPATDEYDDPRPVDWRRVGNQAEEAVALLRKLADARERLMERLAERTWESHEAVRLHAAELLVRRAEPGEVADRAFDLVLRSGDPDRIALLERHVDDLETLLVGVARNGLLPDGGRASDETRAAAAVVLVHDPASPADAIAAALRAARRAPAARLVHATLASGRADLEDVAVEALLRGARGVHARFQLKRLDDLVAVLPRRMRDEDRLTLYRRWYARAEGEQLVSLGRRLLEAGGKENLADRADDVVELVEDEDSPFWTKAFQLSGSLPSAAVSYGALRELVRSHRFGVARAGLTLIRVHDRPEICRSLGMFEDRFPGAEAAGIVGDLARLGGLGARMHLHRLLASGYRELQIMACHAYAECGLLEDVEELLELEDKARRDVRAAAREAIDAIQARVGPTEKGALSVMPSDEDGGRLSVAAGGPGDLAYADAGDA